MEVEFFKFLTYYFTGVGSQLFYVQIQTDYVYEYIFEYM